MCATRPFPPRTSSCIKRVAYLRYVGWLTRTTRVFLGEMLVGVCSGSRTHGSNTAHGQLLHGFGIKGQKHTWCASAHTAHMLDDAIRKIPAIFRDAQPASTASSSVTTCSAFRMTRSAAETNPFWHL